MPTPRPPEPPSGPPGRSDPAARLPDDHPARSAAERLFAELRDECSEVGVSARGMNVAGLEAGVCAYGREARRLGASVEQTVLLLRECLRDERLREGDRVEYERLRETAVRWVIGAYFDAHPER